MRKKVTVIIVTIVVAGIAVFTNHLQKPLSMIRNDILWQTPLGTEMDEVIEVVERGARLKGWEIRGISHNMGYVNYSIRIPDWPDITASGHPVIGEKSIRVYLGKRLFFWHITASWGFDKDGKLIDVYIREILH